MNTTQRLGIHRSVLAASTSVLVLVLSLITPIAADAQELNHAGLVIRHSDGRLIYAYIAFPEESISGVELLRRSGISLVTIGFGGLGEGVCAIDGEGCPASDCRTRVCQESGPDAPYWQYFRQRSPGDWQSLSLGASATKVRNGDIDGWSWTGHDAQIPSLTISEVAGLAGVSGTEVTDAAAIPTPAVETVFPRGYVQAPETDDSQNLVTYLVGAGSLVVVGGAAVVAIRRRRRLDDAA